MKEYPVHLKEFNKRFRQEPDEAELTRRALSAAACSYPGFFGTSGKRSSAGFAYQEKGLDRLMVAIFARAARDVYHQDKLIRAEARDWMRRYGREYLLDCGIDLPMERIFEWVGSGFKLPPHRKRILMKKGANYE